ncbi:hypothetical protein GCM10017783_04750 [Deinococcus piscis]|uniref:Uncharacterized protein n=1 Tax=Deinococcus piscis TaxID=394230 RepID=A0ABQ3JYI4_9DEIO|nr:hypothetical protein GCM10017783_04750 [Deinococcus piscis]
MVVAALAAGRGVAGVLAALVLVTELVLLAELGGVTVRTGGTAG